MSERILRGDALEALRTLEPERAHACVTSPPCCEIAQKRIQRNRSFMNRYKYKTTCARC